MNDVVGGGDGIVAQLGIVGVYIVDVGSIVNMIEEWCAQVGNLVPAHVGNFLNSQRSTVYGQRLIGRLRAVCTSGWRLLTVVCCLLT